MSEAPRIRNLFTALVAVALVPSSVVADTFVISPPTTLDACNEEFETLANALQPGDELVLNDGVYSQACARRININGTPSNPIVIRAADGASPLITRPPSTSSTNNNLELAGSYYTARGLRFQYGSTGVRFLSSHHITFEDNAIFDTLNNALTMNSGATDSHIIRGNEIYNTGQASGSTEGEGIYVGQHSGGSPGTNHLIENNYIHDLRATSSGGNDGIEIKFGSGGNTVRGNVIHDTNIGQTFPCVFVYGHGAAPNVIENNLMYNCGQAMLVTADAIIRNNVILNSSISGILLRVQSPAPSIRNVSIINNTVYGSHPVCAELRIGSAPNVVVANNAFYCEDSQAVSGNGFDNADMRNNVIRGGVPSGLVDGSRLIAGAVATAQFIDPNAQDFRLLETASLIDAGSADSDAGAVDYASQPRVSGAAIDVGAHEYQQGASPPPPPPAEPTLAFVAPASVTAGARAELRWTTTDADTCTASDGWQGPRPVNGSETSAPLAELTRFTLTCSGEGGTVVRTAEVAIEAPLEDTDADGLLDQWEMDNFGGLSQSAEDDPDEDQLSNAQELALGTDPNDADSDGEGVTDGNEVLIHGTNPLLPDTDADGASDFTEIQQGSDPNDSGSLPPPPTPPQAPSTPDVSSSGGGSTSLFVLVQLALLGVWRRSTRVGATPSQH